MKIKLIIVLLIFCFLSKGKIYSQTIKIHYHLGYDCRPEINGKAIMGGCITNERMKYTPKKEGKYIVSNKLEYEKGVIQFENGEFSKNFVEVNTKTFRFNKRISLREFNQLITYLTLVESEFDDKTDSLEFLGKKTISKWDKNTFELDQREIERIKKKHNKENENLSTDSLIQIINTYIYSSNEFFFMSSVVELLNVSFEYEKKKYSISQCHLGGVNVSWEIEIDDKRYSVISPELNKMISPFLAKKMGAKKKINQFLKIEELERAFTRE